MGDARADRGGLFIATAGAPDFYTLGPSTLYYSSTRSGRPAGCAPAATPTSGSPTATAASPSPGGGQRRNAWSNVPLTIAAYAKPVDGGNTAAQQWAAATANMGTLLLMAVRVADVGKEPVDVAGQLGLAGVVDVENVSAAAPVRFVVAEAVRPTASGTCCGRASGWPSRCAPGCRSGSGVRNPPPSPSGRGWGDGRPRGRPRRREARICRPAPVSPAEAGEGGGDALLRHETERAARA